MTVVFKRYFYLCVPILPFRLGYDNDNFETTKLIKMFYSNLLLQIREQCQELILSDKQIEEIMRRLLKEINRGLGKATQPEADIKCFITYVQDLPNGKGNTS